MIGTPRFRLERLGRDHDRASFKCSREEALERYFVDSGRALRENDRNIAAVYVLIDTLNGRIAGFFTISNTSIIPASLPRAVARKLPRYDHWPAVRLGRMARHDDYAGSGLGAILVAHAFNLALDVAKRSGSFSLVVDAKNLDLSRWYVALGFTPFIDKPLMLFIVNETMKSYLDAVQQRLADED